MNYNCYNILVSVLQKRLTNTDSSIGAMCSLIDAIYGSGISGITAKSCCFVPHTENNVGTFMTCQSNTALSVANFFSQGTAGTCDTSTTSCGGLAPEEEVWSDSPQREGQKCSKEFISTKSLLLGLMLSQY